MSVPVCRQIYTIRMAAVYASLFHYFSRGTESLCGTVSYKGFEKFAGWTGMFTPDCPAIPEDRLGVLPGILHIRPLWSRIRAGCLSVTLPSCCSAIPDSQPSYIFLVGPDIFAQGDDTGFGSGLQPFRRKTVSKAFNNPGPEAARPYR